MPFYNAETKGFYATRAEAPPGSIEISATRKNELLAGERAGSSIEPNANGEPILVQRAITAAVLCSQVDAAADRARHKVAGDPLRAEEYKAAASEAAAFAAANYQGNVPPMVAAWVTPNRTAQQAADDIINEANAYNAALVQLRTTRLQAKEHIRALMAADDVEQAQALAEQTVAAIEAAVAGIGNNA